MIITDGLLSVQSLEQSTPSRIVMGLCTGNMPTMAQAESVCMGSFFSWAGAQAMATLIGQMGGAQLLGAEATNVQYEFSKGGILLPLSLASTNFVVNTTGAPKWGYVLWSWWWPNAESFTFYTGGSSYSRMFNYVIFSVGDEYSNADLKIKTGSLTAGAVFKAPDIFIPFGGDNLLC